MITLWHDPVTDEYTLTEDGTKEILSRMAGDYLRDCATENARLLMENDRLLRENRQLKAIALKVRNLTEELGLVEL